jgi:chromosome partitioning protein
MKSIAFFNNKGGVGKTSLVYHLGWSFADEGRRVLLVDLDPQSNLTAMCVGEERLEALWPEDRPRRTVRGAVQPLVDALGDIEEAHLEPLSNRLSLVPGDIRLADFEQRLSDAWPRCMDRDPAAFRVFSSIYRMIRAAAEAHEAELVLIDVGPNLGAINRASLLAAEYVTVPLAADLFSLQGLRNLGPTLEQWREGWAERLQKNPSPQLLLPTGATTPIGYVVMQPALHAGQATRAHERWLRQIPSVYSRQILGREVPPDLGVSDDPACLGVLRHYRSLMPLAQAARKPIFKLTTADGAMGAHSQAAREVGREIRALGARLLEAIELTEKL